MKTHTDHTTFASTPPLENLKYFLAAMVERKVSKHGKKLKIGIIDVKRAHLRAPIKYKAYIELPPEEGAGPDMCGELQMSMYGMRRAAVS